MPAVVILGLAGLALHHGALGAMRSAGRLGIPVWHVQTDRRFPSERSRYARGGVFVSSDATDGRTLEVLRELGVQLGRSMIVAVDDASAMFLDVHCDALADVFLLPAQPKGLARALVDKRSMHELCLEHAVATPMVTFPICESDISAHAAHAQFPVVVKRIDASLPMEPATPNVLVAHNRDELFAAYQAMESGLGPNVMIQEYIPDAPEANWMFNGYFDSDARCKTAFTGRKLRQSPPDAGAATLGVCEANPTLDGITTSFLAAVGYRGIVDIDYRFDYRDGIYKLLDVNPRIGSSFRLFVSSEGIDVLRAQYFDLTGRHVVPITQQEGRRWVVEPQDTQTSMMCLRSKDLAVRGWLRSLRHVQETAWWATDDPWPFLAMAGSLMIGRLRKMLGMRSVRS